MRVMQEKASKDAHDRARRELFRLAQDELPGHSHTLIASGNDIAAEVACRAEGADLLILGLQRVSRRHKVFGDVNVRIAQQTSCAIIMISRRG